MNAIQLLSNPSPSIGKDVQTFINVLRQKGFRICKASGELMLNQLRSQGLSDTYVRYWMSICNRLPVPQRRIDEEM